MTEKDPPNLPATSTKHPRAAKTAIRIRRYNEAVQRFNSVKSSGTGATSRMLERISTKGVSSWLTTLPLREHGFSLGKRDFRDAVALRYGWPIADIPVTCVCGQAFDVAHAMCCPRGGFPTLRHNEVRDILADLLTEVSPGVATEPLLQPLNGEQFQASSTIVADDARADLRVSGFWTRAEEAFFDVRVFYPNAPSYRDRNLGDVLKIHENQKRLQYGERIVNVDRGSFTPLVFTTDGCCAPECQRFLSRLCGKLADKDSRPYSQTISFVRGRLSFALLRAAIMCLRGSRSSYHRPTNELRGLAIAEGDFE